MSSVAPRLAASSPLDPALLGHYEGLDDALVRGFLAGHPRVVPLLVAAIPAVERVFGADARMALAVVAEASGALTLYVTILDEPSLDTEAQLERLGRFDDMWWLAQDRSAGPVVFAVGDA